MSNKKIVMQVSPLNNNIYAGTLKPCLKIFKQKQDVTIDALYAVAEHGLNFGEPIILGSKEGEQIKITVEKINKEVEK